MCLNNAELHRVYSNTNIDYIFPTKITNTNLGNNFINLDNLQSQNNKPRFNLLSDIGAIKENPNKELENDNNQQSEISNHQINDENNNNNASHNSNIYFSERSSIEPNINIPRIKLLEEEEVKIHTQYRHSLHKNIPGILFCRNGIY